MDYEERCPGDSTKMIPELQEDLYDDSTKKFLSFCDDIFPSPPIPTKVVQLTVKGEGY
jgi:hypothetical protein